MLTVLAILRLTRFDSCLLGFFAIFLPMIIRTSDLTLSARRAIPLLFTCICTFIANNLDDIEKDRVNHPERPLPAGQLTPAVATALYFTSLTFALFSTKLYIPPHTAFWYYALLATSISYRYVVEYSPALKAPYVAIATSIPVLIVAAWYPEEKRLYIVVAVILCYTLGKEMCMDIVDRAGDSISFLHRFGPKPLAALAFALQTMGWLLLATQIRKLLDVVNLMTMLLLLVISAIYWFKLTKYKDALYAMRVQYVLGLYFLA